MLSFLLAYSTTGSCYFKDGNYSFVPNVIDKDNAVAYATWNNSINENGWYQFHVHSTKKYPDEQTMYCAGYLEGALSHQEIFNHFSLILDIKSTIGFSRSEPHYPEEWVDYMQANLDFTKESAEAYQESPYWQKIALILKQFDGLVAGYNSTAPEDQRMTELDHWILQSQGDLGDTSKVIERMNSGRSSGPTLRGETDPEFNEHCTGLIKIAPDGSDIWFAHDAWSDYRDLHGALKEYDLQISAFAAKRVTMSTRVGKLSSYDDYYIADSGLVIMETTMSIFNESLYDLCSYNTLLTWLRAINAVWTANSGKEFTEIFIKHNSGTYNNQYLVIDTRKFTPFKPLPESDLLWVIEQYPGDNWRSADITKRLVDETYFPSINKPSFEELYNIAGYPDKIRSVGRAGYFYEYKKSARYMITQREQSRIKTFDDFKAFMRYNNWKNDKFSDNDPSQQIMSRYDLRQDNNPYGVAKAFGGLDSKCLRITEAATKMHFHAIASPANDNNPTWEFGQEKFPVKYDGLPKVWNFKWIEFESDNQNKCSGIPEKDCKNTTYCGWCTYSSTCMPGNKEGPYFGAKCEDGWSTYTELQPWAIPVIITTSVIILVSVLTIYAIHFLKH